MPLQHRQKGLLALHAAVFLFSLAGVLGKAVEASAPAIVAARTGIGAASLLCFCLVERQSLRLARRQISIAVFLGAALLVHWLLFFYAVRVSTVAIALLTFSTFPVFVALLEPFFGDRALTRRDLLLCAIVLFGIALAVPDLRFSGTDATGAAAGTLSGLVFAVLQLVCRYGMPECPSTVIAFSQNAFAFILLVAISPGVLTGVSRHDWLILAVLGTVCTAFAHTLFLWGLKDIRARTASIIATLEPVYGSVLAAWWLGEVPLTRTMIGGAIVLAAAFRAGNGAAEGEGSATERLGADGLL